MFDWFGITHMLRTYQTKHDVPHYHHMQNKQNNAAHDRSAKSSPRKADLGDVVDGKYRASHVSIKPRSLHVGLSEAELDQGD